MGAGVVRTPHLATTRTRPARARRPRRGTRARRSRWRRRRRRRGARPRRPSAGRSGRTSATASVTSSTSSRRSAANQPLSSSIRLPNGRVVRERLLDEVGPAVELGLQVAGEVATVAVVRGVHGALGMLPVGVDDERGVHLVVERPGQTGAVPGGVERHLGEHPVAVVADLVEVARVRGDPLRRALEDRDALGLPDDGRDDLHRAGAGPDDRDAPAGEVEVVGPAGGVEEGAVEAVESREVGHRRAVELPDRARSAGRRCGSRGSRRPGGR